MKQTAVEWLETQILEIGQNNYLSLRELFEQAKQMEKGQSKQDYDSGLFDGTMDDVKDRLYKNAEQYYNETYGDQLKSKQCTAKD
jgi:response regulator of citrate/malate metabolism